GEKRGELRARGDAQLLIHRAEVLLDGLVADAQPARDLDVRAAFRGQQGDLALAARQRPDRLAVYARRGRARRRSAERFEPPHVEQRAAAAVDGERRVRIARALERGGLEQRESQAAESVGGRARERYGFLVASRSAQRLGVEQAERVPLRDLDRRVGRAREVGARPGGVARRPVPARGEQRERHAARTLALRERARRTRISAKPGAHSVSAAAETFPANPSNHVAISRGSSRYAPASAPAAAAIVEVTRLSTEAGTCSSARRASSRSPRITAHSAPTA